MSESYKPPFKKDGGNDGGDGYNNNSSSYQGNSGGGYQRNNNYRGNSSGYRGNSSNYRGNSGGYRGNSNRSRGGSSNYRGNSSNYRGNSSNYRGNSSNYRGNSGGGYQRNNDYRGNSNNYRGGRGGQNNYYQKNSYNDKNDESDMTNRFSKLKFDNNKDQDNSEQKSYGNNYNNKKYNSYDKSDNYKPNSYSSSGNYQSNSSYRGNSSNYRGNSGGSSYRGGGGSSYRYGGGSSFSGGGSGSYYWKSTMFRTHKPDPELEKELFGQEDETTHAGINFDEYDKIDVTMGHADGIQVMESFSHNCGLNKTLLDNIGLCGFTRPTPIQKAAIPCLLEKRDVLACAQTGSGKTAAFLLPMISHMINNYDNLHATYNNGKLIPYSVILSPTRELSLQIYSHSKRFLYCTGLRSTCVFGGAHKGSQIRDFYEGAELLVGTPGRLKDFINMEKITLEYVEYCVLDEADRMLDMGFMPQIQDIIKNMPIASKRNTLMFSATFPQEIQKLAAQFLHEYAFISVGRVGSTSKFIKQKLMKVDNYEKMDKLLKLIPECTDLHATTSKNKDDDDEGDEYDYDLQDSQLKNQIIRILIFVERKKQADFLERKLNDIGIKALSIHGDKTQTDRIYSLNQFKKGKVSVLVATDVASRGLDIPDVLYVINYDMPGHIDQYVHRIGRTGRCGNNGCAISFVSEADSSIFNDLIKLLQESKSEVPEWIYELERNSKFMSSSKRRGGRGRSRGYSNYGYGRGGGYRNRVTDYRYSNDQGNYNDGYKNNMRSFNFGSKNRGGSYNNNNNYRGGQNTGAGRGQRGGSYRGGGGNSYNSYRGGGGQNSYHNNKDQN